MSSLLVSRLVVISMLQGLVENNTFTTKAFYALPAFDVRGPIRIPIAPRPGRRQTEEEIRRLITDHRHSFEPASGDPGMYTLPSGWTAARVENQSRTVLATAIFDKEGAHRMTILITWNNGPSWTEIIE